MRAIDADAIAYESIDSCDTGRHEHYYGTGIIAVRKEDVDAMPTIQPKRGRWIEYEQEFMLEGSLKTVQKTVKECSVCTSKIAGMVGIMNFCPNCGANMEEKT